MNVTRRSTGAPSTIGPYTILGELGRGGMGTVYRARDQRLRRDVALKVLPEELRLSPIRLARFEQEARLVAALSHPNIAAIYGIEDSDPGVQALCSNWSRARRWRRASLRDGSVLTKR